MKSVWGAVNNERLVAVDKASDRKATKIIWTFEVESASLALCVHRVLCIVCGVQCTVTETQESFRLLDFVSS